MTSSDNASKSPAGVQPEKPILSDEVADAAKRAILFGEKVGYKTPPQETRFKKGQSGNPKGRPKRADGALRPSPETTALTIREAERKVTIREGAETRLVSAIEAAMLAQFKAAAGGNAYAQKHLIERYLRAKAEKQREIDEEVAFWEFYVAFYREAIAEASRKGEPPPSPLPHPDDVVIDPDKGVRFIGPFDEESAARLEENLKFRDACLMQDALDRRSAAAGGNEKLSDKQTFALLGAKAMNQSVPLRFRLSDSEMIMKLLRYEHTPMRTLLKDVRAAWHALGVKPRRGKTLPPLAEVLPVFEAVMDGFAAIQRGGGM
jgi:hypothetical protein